LRLVKFEKKGLEVYRRHSPILPVWKIDVDELLFWLKLRSLDATLHGKVCSQDFDKEYGIYSLTHRAALHRRAWRCRSTSLSLLA
jgi:hypothetical protein